MNIAMEQTEEYVNGELTEKYGDCFIRGNNGACKAGLIDHLWLGLMNYGWYVLCLPQFSTSAQFQSALGSSTRSTLTGFVETRTCSLLPTNQLHHCHEFS